MTQTKIIVKIIMMNLSLLKRVTLSGLLIVLGACGENNELDKESFVLALPADEITLVSSIDYEPIRRESGSYTIQSGGTLEVPALIEITQGNTGTGFASLTIGSRKYCFQGQAIDEREINDQGYFFLYQKENIVSECSTLDRGVSIFEPRVAVAAGDEVKLTIESGGCIFAEGTCLFTEARVVLSFID